MRRAIIIVGSDICSVSTQTSFGERITQFYLDAGYVCRKTHLECGGATKPYEVCRVVNPVSTAADANRLLLSHAVAYSERRTLE